MEIEKQIIKTYSRRQPITRYESRAMLVSTNANPTHVRESRLNDKTLVVENFDDTFDRLATGVVVPSPENSLDENGLAKKTDSDVFNVFKVPLQTKKNEKPKQKGKPKKKDLVSKTAAVKRKKVNNDSDDDDDSDLSDQEEIHNKQAISSDNKKSKEKIKKVIKRKKNVSPVKVVTNDKLVVSESTDENASNNINNKTKESAGTDNFKKPKEPIDVNSRKIVQYFQASTPRVGRVQSNMDMQNLSPVIMNIANERTVNLSNIDEEYQAGNTVDDEQNASENAVIMNISTEKTEFPLNMKDNEVADDGHNASENFSKNAEYDQSNNTNTVDIFAKPKNLAKIDLLKISKHLLTSTPRVNKIRMPVNLQHLSPIVSDKAKSSSVKEKSLNTNADAENNQNGVGESNSNDDAQVSSEPVVESVNFPAEVSEIVQSNIKRNEELVSQERTKASQSDKQELIDSNAASEYNNRHKSTNENNTSESIVDNHDDSIIPVANVDLSTNKVLPVNIQSYIHSPLMFDDSEYVQSEIDKSDIVTDVDNVDDVEINFSQNFSENIKQNNEETVNSESANVNPPTNKNTNFYVSAESSFYPDDWTNDYDSTYGYDQHTKNLKKDNTIDSQLKEDDNKNSTSASENAVNKNAENITEINEVSNIDNTEIQSVEDDEQEKAEDTLCDENNVIKNSKSESDDQEEHYSVSSMSNKDNDDSTNVKEDSLQNSQIAVEDKQFSCEKKSANEENHDSTIIEDNSLQKSQITVEEKQSLREDESSDEDNGSSRIIVKDSFQGRQVTVEEKKSYRKDESTLFIDQPDESLTLSDIEDLEDKLPTIIPRPVKRRKTDGGEIMIFNNLEKDKKFVDKSIDEHVSVPEDTISKSVITESTDDTSTPKSDEHEEIIKKLPDKELRIVISRINYDDYKSPISFRGKPGKRKLAKRVSRKFKDTNNESDSRKNKQDKTPKSNSSRITRRSVTEDKMKRLFIQYQCKNLTIYAVKLEDQKIDLPLRRSLKRKSITEDNELDNSLTNGGLTEFLSKLNDPMKVTMKRKTQKKFDRHLAAINENQAGQRSDNVNGKKIVTWGNDKRVTFNEIEENSEDSEDDDHVSQPIFLKPGKSWARSLSLINHFHNGKNLEELAAGRENWRHSVQTLLNMQPEVSSRSHSQNYHEETQRESRVSRAFTQRESKSMRKSSIATNSRFSIRIIPGGKRSTLTDLMDSQRVSYVSDRSRASRKTSLKIRRDTLIETEDDLIRSAKDIILKRCKQTSYEPFDVCFPDPYIDNCRKIGEGVYGEVFLYENGSEKSVIKIIPIEGDQLVNCEPQKKFHEILSEIIIAEELHKLRLDGEFHTNGFVEVNRIMCVIGKYPKKLIDLWYAYDKQKNSENDCPSMFEDDQLYIILELAHGGQDLEAYKFQNASESYAIFLQTALTLAVAEQSLEFEHRDLHWGNLLISKTEDKYSTYKLGSDEISLPTKGVKVAVIDFTLSRMSYQGCKIFNDLAADPTLFEAQGEYQFDIYRMMRDNVNDDWQKFCPFTNILWMDYTLDKMITAVRYKKKTTKIHKSAIEDMKALRKEIMNYSSAFDFVTNCKKVQNLFDST